MSLKIERAAVIGTGMMGPGIAVSLAIGGIPSTILSRSEESAAKGLETAHQQMKLLADHGLAKSWAALDASADFDATIAAADLVIESAPENMAFKQDLFRRMEALAKPDAILTSNTSGLSITDIASGCQRPQRVMTTHFWNPPHLMPLVEVVCGRETDVSLAEGVWEVLQRCGKHAVLVRKDTPGQLGNRLQMALVREAVHIIEEGIADAEAVDTAARMGFGLRLPAYGILEHQDMVGFDMSLGILEYVAQDLYSEKRAPELMRNLMKEGNLGVKTGKGFYDWSSKDAAAVRARRDAFVLEMRKREAKSAS